MKDAKKQTFGFAQIDKFNCNNCSIPLLTNRFHCFDCFIDLCEKCAKLDSQINGHTQSHITSRIPPPVLLEGEALYQAALNLQNDLEKHHIYPGVSTFFANVIKQIVLPLSEELRSSNSFNHIDATAQSILQALQFLVARRQQGRLVDYISRQSFPGREITDHVIAMSQGVPQCMHWRGIPLFKTVFDYALYPMLLWDLKPKTIIETGSANGGSAIWLGDMVKTFNLNCHIYSIDLIKPKLQHEYVTFLEGDCNNIANVLTTEFLARAPHPWLFLEDAHVNINGVLSHLHPYTQAGDYIIIEDTESKGKEDEIGIFAVKHLNDYRVDTHYVDFFGYNATCSMNTIWRRV